MYNQNLVSIKEMKSGRMGVQTPFNRDFKDKLKMLVPDARWNSPYWTFGADKLDQVESLLSEFYPPEDALQKVRIEWDLNCDNPRIDGVDLANASRDYWAWKRDCPVDFKIIEIDKDFNCGGSRRYPGLYGRLVIEAEIRPGADIEPSPEKIEIIEEGETVNPLTDECKAYVAEALRNAESIQEAAKALGIEL